MTRDGIRYALRMYRSLDERLFHGRTSSFVSLRFWGVCEVNFVFLQAYTVCCMFLSVLVEPSLIATFLNFRMGDEGTSTDTCSQNTGKLKVSSKSYRFQSQINLSRGHRRLKLLVRRLSRKIQPKQNSHGKEFKRPCTKETTDDFRLKNRIG